MRMCHRLLFAATLVFLMGASPPAPPTIEILSPVHGSWSAPTHVVMEVAGKASGPAEVFVNGLPATYDQVNEHYWIAWPGMPVDRVFHAVLAELRDSSSGRVLARDRAVVYNPAEYGATAAAENVVVAQATRGFLNRPGFEDLSQLVSAVLSQQLQAALADAAASVISPDQPELRVELPVQPCVDAQEALGVKKLSGISDLVDPLIGTPGEVCVRAVIVDLSAIVPNGVTVNLSPAEGVVDALLSVDSIALQGSVTLDAYVTIVTLPEIGAVEPPGLDPQLTVCSASIRATDLRGCSTEISGLNASA
jgi:hypothetical protein